MTAGCPGYGAHGSRQITEPASPPAGRGLPLVGHLPWFYADTNGFLLRLARSQGDIASFRLGRAQAFLLSHPDHIQRVLVDDADAFRKVVSCSAPGVCWATG